MIRALREECAKEGFDLCDPIHTQWYNDLIEEEGHISKGTLQKIPEPPTILEDNESVDEGGLQYNAVLIGNSKSIWPKFIDWLSSQYEEKLSYMEKNGDLCNKEEILDKVLNDNPFDTFVTETLSRAFRSCCSETREGSIASQLESYEFYWSNGVHYKVNLGQSSNDQESTKNNTDDYHCYAENKTGERESFLVSMQRVAKVTGKYWHDEEGTKLCVHPKFGTWKAFRAVVVFHKTQQQQNSEPNIITIPRAPPMCPSPVAPNEIQKAKEVMDYALKISGNETSTGYGKPSGKSDLCTYLHNSVQRGSDWSKVSPTMRPWLQLRDCISVGREDYKYGDSQLLYHYTKDSEILRNELNKRSKC
mmetsp:Transcript_27042/g.49208  ORF Transcript_27042/g.49208 Transcript_27042/m.49208 type:complete len:362 (-) Transcript_27042:5-1090(-)